MRKAAARAARLQGLEVSAQELQEAAGIFRRTCGLSMGTATVSWFKDNSVTLEYFEEFLETCLLVSKLKVKLGQELERDSYSRLAQIQEEIKEMAYLDWLRGLTEMARIKITDLPGDMKISKEEMKRILGGVGNQALSSGISLGKTIAGPGAKVINPGLKFSEELCESACAGGLCSPGHSTVLTSY